MIKAKDLAAGILLVALVVLLYCVLGYTGLVVAAVAFLLGYKSDSILQACASPTAAKVWWVLDRLSVGCMHASFVIALTIVVTGPGSIELAKQGHDASWLGVAVGLAYGLMAFGATTLGLHWLLHTLHQRRFCPSVA